jgi:hypothetical protein
VLRVVHSRGEQHVCRYSRAAVQLANLEDPVSPSVLVFSCFPLHRWPCYNALILLHAPPATPPHAAVHYATALTEPCISPLPL